MEPDDIAGFCNRYTTSNKFLKPTGVRKNLLNLLCTESTDREEIVSIYLRIKPVDKLERNEGNLEVVDSSTLLCKANSALPNSKYGRLRNDPMKFTFDHIYGPETSQEQLFESCILPQVVNLLQGRSCLLFTYGTTKAGKTHTVLGNLSQPGIIPRTLLTLFSSIEGKLDCNSMRYRPDKVSEVVKLDDKSFEQEKRFKDFIMNSFADYQAKTDCQTFFSTISHSDRNVISSCAQLVSKAIPVGIDDDGFHYSIWVSFMEIYNEAVYDLLEPISFPNKRTQLKLAYDKESCCYVKGLNHVCVENADEAYKVLMVGKRNLHVASTNLNTSSSRSHCIYTIKIVRFENKDDPEYAEISSFTLCDLAGAERQKKTLNIGDRLKESQNINASLHVLGRCFETLRNNQLKKEHFRVPYRDSKLTQIFQRAFDGKHSDKIVMIVNVNPSSLLSEETVHVLKASSIAYQLITGPVNKPPKLSRFSEIIQAHPKGSIMWKTTIAEENESLDEMFPNCDKQRLTDEVTILQEELKEQKNKYDALESRLRKEICEEFMKMIRSNETMWKEQIDATEELYKNHEHDLRSFYERKLKEYCTELDELYELLEQKREDGKLVVSDEKLVHENAELKRSLAEINIKQEFSSQQIDRLNLEINNLKETLKNKDLFIEKAVSEERSIQSQLESQLGEKERVIENLCKLLDEAKDDMLTTEHELEILKDKITDSEIVHEHLRNIIADKDNETKDLESKLEEVNTNLESVLDTIRNKDFIIEELENRLDDIKLDMEKQLSLNERLLCALEKDKDSLIAERKYLNNEIEKLTEQLKDFIEKNNEMQCKLNNYERQLKEFTTENEEQKSRINGLTRSENQLTLNNVKLVGEDNLQNELKNFAEENENLNEEVKRLLLLRENDKATIENMRVHLVKKTDECDQLKSEIRDVIGEYNENIKKSQLAAQCRAQNAAGEQIAAVNKAKIDDQEIKQLRDEINRLQKDLSLCRCKNHDGRPVNEEMKLNIVMKSKMYELQEDNGELKKQVEELRYKLSNMELEKTVELPNFVSPPAKKKYDLRYTRTEPNRKDYKENIPSASKKGLRSANKQRSHKKGGDDIDFKYKEPLNDTTNNCGRRKLFTEELIDLEGVAQLAEAKTMPDLESPESNFKSNMKKFKKRVN